MSIFGAMHTSVSGMNAQSNRLSLLSDNIANADTVGYKGASAQFETVLDDQALNSFASSGVTTRIRYGISQQGLIQTTGKGTDLAIQGQGFFVVSDGAGAPLLTRAGAFVPDADGHLVNTAGFKLMGQDITAGDTQVSASGFSSLSPITIDTSGLVATSSTTGKLFVNLPSTATAVAAVNLPAANAVTAQFTDKTSLIAYDSLGAKVTLDVYMTKTGPNAWQAAVFNQADAASGGGFPYASAPMTTTALAFDPTTGSLASGSATSLSVSIPGGTPLSIDMSKTTQFASDFIVSTAGTNGNAPSAFSNVAIDANGIVSAVYQNGASIPKFRIPLANVPSPDHLSPLNGNVYSVSSASGAPTIGPIGGGGLGKILSSALESSTVDIASELTEMIETQRSYTANSKAFQIGTDMADVLVNLKV